MSRTSILLSCVLLVPAGLCAVQAQADTTYIVLPEAREIALARSAGPISISRDATIWAIREGRYRIVVRGSNGNHCFVARTWGESLEPVCYDPEGARTILPLEIRRFELRRQGLSPDEVDRAVENAIGRGDLAMPDRPAMSYMMSSAQRLIDDNGSSAGNWKPHLMLYWPYVTLEQLGATGGPTGELMVVDPGRPTAYVVIVVPDFVDPDPT